MEVIIVTTMSEMGYEAVKNVVRTSWKCLLVLIVAIFALN